MTPHVSLWSLAGANQFAYTKKRGSRDVLALLTMRWLKALDLNMKILVYCSDVSGAFDRVDKDRLVAKVRKKKLQYSNLGLGNEEQRYWSAGRRQTSLS